MKKFTVILIVFLIFLAFLIGFSNAKFYGFGNQSYNAGVAWNNIGGVEFYPSFGVFVCDNNKELSRLFPSLVTDC